MSSRKRNYIIIFERNILAKVLINSKTMKSYYKFQ